MNSTITIITYNGRTQTNLDTIKKCDKLVSMINNNTIYLDIDINNMKKILNYLRGYDINCSIKHIAYDSKCLGINLELPNHVYVNISGEIYYLEKNLLVAKLEYFEKFFEYNHSLEPDYSSIVIDRCPDIFDDVLQYIQQEKPLYLKVKPKINSSLSNELDFYMKKPVQILPVIFNLSGFYYYENNFISYLCEKILLSDANDNNLFFNISPKKFYPKIIFELDTLDNINENDLYSKISAKHAYSLSYDKIHKLVYIYLIIGGFTRGEIQINIDKSIRIKNNCLYGYYDLTKLEPSNMVSDDYFYKELYFKKQLSVNCLDNPTNMFEINFNNIFRCENIRKNLMLGTEDLDRLLSNYAYKFDIKIITKKNIKINFVEIKHDNKIIYRSNVTTYWVDDLNHSTIKYVENKKLDLKFFLSQKNRNDNMIIYFNDAINDNIKIYIKCDIVSNI
nr:putative BTB/POZ domain-containing protein [Megavirus caiporensis]